MATILATHVLRLDREDDIVVVRRRVRDIAELRKFDSFATAAITTATSELARNVIVHGGTGTATIDEVSDSITSALFSAHSASGLFTHVAFGPQRLR